MPNPVSLTRAALRVWCLELQGWTCPNCDEGPPHLGCLIDKWGIDYARAPDPTTDISAAFALPNILTDDQKEDYGYELARLVLGDEIWEQGCDIQWQEAGEIAQATPLQRCCAAYFALEGVPVEVRTEL